MNTFYLKKKSARQIDAFNYEEDDGTFRQEVFNGTSTVVEVAIKTKKKGKSNKNRNADEMRYIEVLPPVTLQGSTSRRFKPPVDFDLKVAF